ncbi:MAG: ABC transporter permease [Deltaproteobacteria bacterium]|nr:MAG: ABC transporter permease [Deltaproteobacteria bacterium]
MKVSEILREIKVLLRIYASSKSSLFGLTVVIGYIIMAAIGPYFIRLDLIGLDKPYQLPSLKHPFGTDYLGRDIFAQIVHGARDVLLLAFIASLITVAISVSLGTIAGIKGGKVDSCLMFITDMMLTIPGFPLLIVVTSLIKGTSNPLILGLIYAMVSWASPARAIRSQVLSLKRRDFVEASRCMGFSTLYIIYFDILPLIMPYVAVNLLLIMIGAIYSLVGLSLIGAIPWSECNWGIMINVAVNYAGALSVPKALPHLIAPLGMIILLQVALIMLSRSIEMIFNPRLRER